MGRLPLQGVLIWWLLWCTAEYVLRDASRAGQDHLSPDVSGL